MRKSLFLELAKNWVYQQRKTDHVLVECARYVYEEAADLGLPGLDFLTKLYECNSPEGARLIIAVLDALKNCGKPSGCTH